MTTVGVNGRTFSVDEPGGAVQASINQYRQLEAHPELDVVLFGSQKLRAQFPGATVINSYYRGRSQAYGVFWEQFILPRLVSKYDIDVLYCPNGNSPVSTIDVPVVLCIHDVNALHGLSSGVHQFYRSTVVPRAAMAADRIVTVSEFSKGEIAEYTGVCPEKIDVIYNGVDELFLSGDSEPIDLPEKYVLFVGSLNPRKNIRGVLNAFLKFTRKTETDHKLALIGPSNKDIFKDIDLGLEDREDIILPGFVSEHELKYSYERASLFLYPSYYEGFGLPPLEAMACGTPVVASDRAALPEILNGHCTLVDPDDIDAICNAICEGIADPLSELELQEARRHVKRYTWTRTGERLGNAVLAAART